MNKNFFFSVFLLGAFFTGCKIDVHHDEPLPRTPSCQMDYTYVEAYAGDSRYWKPIVTCSVKHARNNAVCQIRFQDLDNPWLLDDTTANLDYYGNARVDVVTRGNCDLYNPKYSNGMSWRAECVVDGHVLKALDTHGYLPCTVSPFVE